MPIPDLSGNPVDLPALWRARCEVEAECNRHPDVPDDLAARLYELEAQIRAAEPIDLAGLVIQARQLVEDVAGSQAEYFAKAMLAGLEKVATA
jgi:hypothetical protein